LLIHKARNHLSSQRCEANAQSRATVRGVRASATPQCSELRARRERRAAELAKRLRQKGKSHRNTRYPRKLRRQCARNWGRLAPGYTFSRGVLQMSGVGGGNFMKHLAFAVLALALAVGGTAQFSTAQASEIKVESQDGAKQQGVVSAIGNWTGAVSGWEGIFTWEFYADGSWRGGRVGSDLPDAGRWSQVGNHVAWLYDNGTVYYAQMSSGDAMSGRATWADGTLVGSFALTRK
jgi:hypothetical protein